jgi:hypothetical protein
MQDEWKAVVCSQSRLECSPLNSRGGSIGSCILYATGQKVRKIGEPWAGFDLRKRTIEDAFSEGIPIWGWAAMSRWIIPASPY